MEKRISGLRNSSCLRFRMMRYSRSVISDSICMSSHKAALQGAEHKRVPDDIHINPTIIGHEFAGVIMEVGKKWQHKFKAGQKFSIQPAMSQMGTLNAPGYSYRYIGGDATHVIIPPIVMEADCLLPYDGEAFFPGFTFRTYVMYCRSFSCKLSYTSGNICSQYGYP